MCTLYGIHYLSSAVPLQLINFGKKNYKYVIRPETLCYVTFIGRFATPSIFYLKLFVHSSIHPSIHQYMHTYIHTYIHFFFFDFDALAQGNAYKPTKEQINYRGPSRDRTHDLQTEATPPAASCPARSLHATEIVSENTIPMTCPRLHWTTDNPSGMQGCQFQHLCVLILNCALELASCLPLLNAGFEPKVSDS